MYSLPSNASFLRCNMRISEFQINKIDDVNVTWSRPQPQLSTLTSPLIKQHHATHIRKPHPAHAVQFGTNIQTEWQAVFAKWKSQIGWYCRHLLNQYLNMGVKSERQRFMMWEWVCVYALEQTMCRRMIWTTPLSCLIFGRWCNGILTPIY